MAHDRHIPLGGGINPRGWCTSGAGGRGRGELALGVADRAGEGVHRGRSRVWVRRATSTSSAVMRRLELDVPVPSGRSCALTRGRVEQSQHGVGIHSGLENTELGRDLHRFARRYHGRPELGRVQQRHDELARLGEHAPAWSERVPAQRASRRCPGRRRAAPTRTGWSRAGSGAAAVRSGTRDSATPPAARSACRASMAAGSRRDGSRLRIPSAGAITTSGASHATNGVVGRGQSVPDQRGDGRELVAVGVGCGPAGLAQVADVLHPGQRHPMRAGRGATAKEHGAGLGHGATECEGGRGQRYRSHQRHLHADHSRSSTAGEPITPSGSTMPSTPPGASSRTERANPATLGSIRVRPASRGMTRGGGGHTRRIVVLSLAEWRDWSGSAARVRAARPQ